MRSSRIVGACGILISVALCGCETPWYTMESAADVLIPPTNCSKEEMSRQDFADTVGKPADLGPFANQAVYMGDKDGFRYVHVRDMSRFWGFLGECDYVIPASQWPMEHPMPFTQDVTKWQDVTWLGGGDASISVPQNPSLYTTPSFPVGAPTTRPAMVPATIDFTNQPSPDSAPSTAPTTLPDAPVIPASAPAATQPSTSP